MVAAIVLAAGAGSRFGGGKLLALLDGRPILQHVLDTVATLPLSPVVVVTGPEGPALERVIAWRDERRVTNPFWRQGMSTSIRAGLDALTSTSAAAALILLADQPLVARSAIEALLAAPLTPARPIAAARYPDGLLAPPVVVARAYWPRAAEIDGDRGLGPVFAAHPELVLAVPVRAPNPDIDTRADLDGLEHAADDDVGS